MNGAVITALNEAETIGSLVCQLREQGLSVCVVDDGSTDDTGLQARLAGAHVIYHNKPKGIGKSLVEAWRYAVLQRWERVAQLDAGGSHNPQSATYYLCFSEDVVIGTRFTGKYDYLGGSWWRKLGSKLTAQALNFATRQRITDWTSGYRCFSLRALQALVDAQYTTNMHTWQIEVLHEALRRGLTIAEAPITYKAGRSTLKWSTIDDLIKVYLQIFFAVPL